MAPNGFGDSPTENEDPQSNGENKTKKGLEDKSAGNLRRNPKRKTPFTGVRAQEKGTPEGKAVLLVLLPDGSSFRFGRKMQDGHDVNSGSVITVTVGLTFS